MDRDLFKQEPPIGSVVAIDWGGHYQEVWVSNGANIGSWYTTDVPLAAGWHPTWYDVQQRANGRTLTLLVADEGDAFRAGYEAGVTAAAETIGQAVEEARSALPRREGPPGPPPQVARLREAVFDHLRERSGND